MQDDRCFTAARNPLNQHVLKRRLSDDKILFPLYGCNDIVQGSFLVTGKVGYQKLVIGCNIVVIVTCLLYTSDAADD